MISIAIFIIILLITIRQSIVGFVLLYQIYIIKSLKYISLSNLKDINSESDILLTFILPISVLSIILTKLFFKKSRVKYKIDRFDIFFLFLIYFFLLASIYSIDITKGVIYVIKLLFLGYGLFFVIKIYLINDIYMIKNNIRIFFFSVLSISIMFTVLSNGMIYFNNLSIGRMTLVGVSVIPFAQLIGYGILILWHNILSNGSFLGYHKRYFISLNFIFLIILLLSLLATNTRGVILATLLSMLLIYILLKDKKVNIKSISLKVIFFIGLGISLFVFINTIGIENLLNRILNNTSQSNDERLIAINDSIYLISNNLFGIGPDIFSTYSDISYPHNFLLEIMVSIGLIGLLIIIYLMAILFSSLLRLDRYDNISVFLFVLTGFFFIEAQFSFSLWMNKGFYIGMGMMSAYEYIKKKNNYNK